VLTARYAANAGVELSGTPEELAELARSLDASEEATVALSVAPPEPYDRSLTVIDLVHSDWQWMPTRSQSEVTP